MASPETRSEPVSVAPPARQAVLDAIAAGKRSRLRRYGVPLLVLGLAGGAAAFYFLGGRKGAVQPYEYVTAPATRGDLKAVVTATGNLRAVDTVQVGAETNGKVRAVHVDVNDRVKAGQVLCEIDPQQLKAGREQARAQLLAAQAELKNRQASAREAKLAADRARELAKQGLASDAQLESAVAAAERADAAMQSGEAQIVVARAALSNTETQLEKTIIRAPGDGVVLSRAVEVGQTVISAMQAPVLFTLARDLRFMELTVGIDEADVGHVHEGQMASFTVDAYPGQTFSGKVRLIQNVATVVDNVVTYEARLDLENTEQKLRPGMTATVTILTDERKDVLLVPNAALRFKPVVQREIRAMTPFAPMARGPRPAEGRPAAQNGPAVYVLKGGAPSRVALETGLTDGTVTEVRSGELEPGAALLTDMIERKE